MRFSNFSCEMPAPPLHSLHIIMKFILYFCKISCSLNIRAWGQQLVDPQGIHELIKRIP